MPNTPTHDAAQELYLLLAETLDGSVPSDWPARRNAALLRASKAGLDTPDWLSDRMEPWEDPDDA